MATNEELVKKIQEGDNGLMFELWEQVRRFIILKARSFAQNHANSGRVDLEDLIQSGYLALADAVKTYNETAGSSFIGYLTFHLKRYFRKEAGILSSRRDALNEALSLDATLPGEHEDDITLLDILQSQEAAEDFENMLDRLHNQQIVNIILMHMQQLEPLQRDVIIQYYLQQRSYKEIAEQYDITIREVNRILKRGIRALNSMPMIRKLQRDLYIDERTSFYKHKGYKAFNTSFSSVVEDAVIKREQKEHRL